MEKHVEEVNALVKEAAKAAGEIDEEDEEEEKDEDGQADRDQVDIPERALKSHHEEEFIDEDLYTTVTVDAVNISKDGFHKVAQEEEEGGDDNKPTAGRPSIRPGAKRIWTKERPHGPKKKKKPFRYESKAERKVTRFKERSGNKSKAKARKE